MGYGVPAGIAAAVTQRRTVVTFAGDGDFLMTGQELATATQHGAKTIVILLNNGMYGTIRMHQERDFPTHNMGSNLNNPHFANLAKAYGYEGIRISKTEVVANGQPYALGTERGKGSHSMAGYHSFELCYLAATYTNLLIHKEPMDFHFRPKPGGFADGILRVQPDILPKGSIRIGEVWIDGHSYTDFDAEGLTVKLPEGHGDIRVRVRIVPSSVRFDADLLSVKGGIGQIALAGKMTPLDLKYLDEAVTGAVEKGATGLAIDASQLESICAEGLRYLVFRKQKAGQDFAISISGANEAVIAAIRASEFDEEIDIL